MISYWGVDHGDEEVSKAMKEKNKRRLKTVGVGAGIASGALAVAYPSKVIGFAGRGVTRTGKGMTRFAGPNGPKYADKAVKLGGAGALSVYGAKQYDNAKKNPKNNNWGW